MVEAQIAEMKENLDKELNKIGNLVHESVVVSKNEDDNEIVSTWGDVTSTGEQYLHHHEVCFSLEYMANDIYLVSCVRYSGVLVAMSRSGV